LLLALPDGPRSMRVPRPESGVSALRVTIANAGNSLHYPLSLHARALLRRRDCWTL